MQVPKYYFHLDVLIVCCALFVLSLAGNLFLYLEYHGLVREFSQVSIQAQLEGLNRGSLEAALDNCRALVAEAPSCPSENLAASPAE